MPELHANCVAVEAALAAHGTAGRVKILPDAAPTAAAAAQQLGIEVGAIANSLVFRAPSGEGVLIMASGAHRIDPALAAAAFGVAALERADPAFVRAATSQPIGGVAPVGHPSRLRTIVDEDLAAFPVIWAAGGIPHAVFPTTFAELVALTGGRPAKVA